MKNEKMKNNILCIALIAALMFSCFSNISFAKANPLLNDVATNQVAERSDLVQKAVDEHFNPTEQIAKDKIVPKFTLAEALNIDPIARVLDWTFSGLSLIRGAYLASVLQSGMGDCYAETPLAGMDKCSSCNEDPYRICTKERCLILGNCIPVERSNLTVGGVQIKGSGKDYVCEPGVCDDIGDVHFKKFSVNVHNESAIVENKDFSSADGIVEADLGEIPFNAKYISVNATIDNDKTAKCVYSLDKLGMKMSEMESFDDVDFAKSPTASILLPGNIQRGMTHIIYIKCVNICGVEHEANYDYNKIVFRLAAKPDQLPPTIVYTDPATPGAVPINWKSVNITIALDENGICRFSSRYTNFTTTWEEMTSMTGTGQDPGYNDAITPSSVRKSWCVQDQKCVDRDQKKCAHCFMELDLTKGSNDLNWSSLDEPTQEQIRGSGLENTTKTFIYNLRCADTNGNKMAEEDSLNYILYGIPGYSISIVKPVNNEATYVREPDIEVNSSPRNTECRYQISKLPAASRPVWDEMTPIDEALADYHAGKHNETLNATVSGTQYRIVAACRDLFKLESRDEHIFTIKQDVTPPKVIRAYHDTSVGEYLLIETDEISECAYGISTCNYTFSEGNAMTTADGFAHSGNWPYNDYYNYYIKCKDKWGNAPAAGQCTTIISPYEIPALTV